MRRVRTQLSLGVLIAGLAGCLGEYLADPGAPDDPARGAPAQPSGAPAGPAPDGGAVDAAPPAADAAACLPALATTDKGKHHPGESCARCHEGIKAPRFASAGTLYDGRTGTVPVAGATIELIDAAGKIVRLTTALNGNFYTTEPLVLPVFTRASACPADRPMISKVQNGDCNAAGCHVAGNRIYLP